MNVAWFEMRAERKRKLDAAVWVPLRSVQKIECVGKNGHSGFKEDFLGIGTLAVPIDARQLADQLEWMDIGISHHHRGQTEGSEYLPCDVYELGEEGIVGIHLVLDQYHNRLDGEEWHLHQDLVTALKLKREGDHWLSPNEGYVEVARLKKDAGGKSVLLEIRAEYLKDYLCARSMALYATIYRERTAVIEGRNNIGWDKDPYAEEFDGGSWEGRIQEIHEGGRNFGGNCAVFHMSRTDVDPSEDVPTFGLPTDENVKSDTWTIKDQGRKLYRVIGEYWRNEWVEPAPQSFRVRGDRSPATIFFITTADGKRESRETLMGAGRWLWFRPEVVMPLAHRRGGGMKWHTRDTGSIWCSPDDDVHFGVNKLCLINVYAKDIAMLDDWQQQIWAGYNVSPDGGVSEELLAAQMQANPADTWAPEGYLNQALSQFADLGQDKLGIQILRPHKDIADILTRTHRFRATDRAGLFALAKDLTRVTADSIDLAELHKLLKLPKGDKTGSLKSLEKILATKIDAMDARNMLTPLVAIYDLRLADAHLPRESINASLTLAGLDLDASTIFQGMQLIHACVIALNSISDVFRKWDSLPKREKE